MSNALLRSAHSEPERHLHPIPLCILLKKSTAAVSMVFYYDSQIAPLKVNCVILSWNLEKLKKRNIDIKDNLWC